MRAINREDRDVVVADLGIRPGVLTGNVSDILAGLVRVLFLLRIALADTNRLISSPRWEAKEDNRVPHTIHARAIVDAARIGHLEVFASKAASIRISAA